MASVFFSAPDELSRVQNTFSVDGVDTDPAQVTLTITSPAGVVTSFDYPTDVRRTGLGSYYYDVDVSTEAGIWQYDWFAVGIVDDHETGTWQVFESQLGHLYAGVNDLKSRFSIGDTADDLELHGACFAASRYIERLCERQFYRTVATEVKTLDPGPWPDGLYGLELPAFCDLVSITQLATDDQGVGSYDTVWDPTDYQLLPQNPSRGGEQWPYTGIKAVGNRTFPVIYQPLLRRVDRIQITGVYGWPAVPYPVRQAALIKAAELFKLKDAPFGIAGFGDFGAVRVRDNPVVSALLAPYMRNPVVIA